LYKHVLSIKVYVVATYRKISGWGGREATEKRPKISKKYRKIALFGLLQGGTKEKRP